MIEELKKYSKKESLVLLPVTDNDLYNSLNYTFGNIVSLDSNKDKEKALEIINTSSLKKIYLVGNHLLYSFILPQIKKHIKICWIYRSTFSALSNYNTRNILNTIFVYYDRELIKSIGCLTKDNYEVFKNAGYNCELIDLKEKTKKTTFKKNNNIGILSNDVDPNNNIYNQLAALTFLEYNQCKLNYCMGATQHFIDYFHLKCSKEENIDKLISNNLVNLYINFTNTNELLIHKSFQKGIPCIVGNTNMFKNNDYLQKHIVMKSDDDINEIVEKIEFAKNNREKIIEEYNKVVN